MRSAVQKLAEGSGRRPPPLSAPSPGDTVPHRRPPPLPAISHRPRSAQPHAGGPATAKSGATGSASAPANSPTGTGIATGSQTSATVVHRYHTVLAGAMRLAGKLCSQLGSTSIVGIWPPPGFNAVIANLAVAFSGKATLNLNPADSPDLIRTKLEHCPVTKLLTTAQFLNVACNSIYPRRGTHRH